MVRLLIHSEAPAHADMADGGEARLRRFDLARELMAEDEWQHASREDFCSELEKRLNTQLEVALEAGRGLPPPIVLRSLLSEQDVSAIFAYVASVTGQVEDSDGCEEAFEPGSEAWLAEQLRLTNALERQYDDEDSSVAGDDDAPGAWVECADAHQKLFVHRGGAGPNGNFQLACPALLSKLIAAARTQADRAGMCAAHVPLNVRCIEFHECECIASERLRDGMCPAAAARPLDRVLASRHVPRGSSAAFRSRARFPSWQTAPAVA